MGKIYERDPTKKRMGMLYKTIRWDVVKELINVRPISAMLLGLIVNWIGYGILAGGMLGSEVPIPSFLTGDIFFTGLALVSVVCLVLMSTKSLLPALLLFSTGVLFIFSSAPVLYTLAIFAAAVVSAYIFEKFSAFRPIH